MSSRTLTPCAPFRFCDPVRSPDAAKDPEKRLEFKPGVSIQPSRTSQEVQINNQALDDSDADAIVALIAEGKVKKLLLTNNQLGSGAAAKIVACLETNTTLTSLSLHSNRLGNAGAAQFANFLQGKNATLTSLFLSANDIDDGAKQTLRSLNEERTPKLSGLTGLVL